MYETSNQPTGELSLRRPAGRRSKVAAAAGLAAVLVLLVLIAVACNSRTDRTAAPAGSETPTASVGPPGTDGPGSGTGTGENTGQSGIGGGGGPGGGGPGPGNQGDPDPDPEDPAEPDPLGIETTVSGPVVQGGCTASGKIGVTGGDEDDYQLSLTYRWFWMPITEPAGLLPEAVQFGADSKVIFTGPGQVSVASPEFPDDDDAAKNRVMLQVSSPDGEVDSAWVTYPKCGLVVAQTD